MLKLERGSPRSHFAEKSVEGTVNYHKINYLMLIQMRTYSFHFKWVLFTATWCILGLQVEIGCRHIL